ncbi:hypothetical protein [Maritalea sp.]|uniref:hypothetical protein n=1 Tax=Maritalea sp. TaxID=2003361 RepID=UPI003EF38B75
MSIIKLYLNKNLDDLKKKFIREAIKGDNEAAKKIIAADESVVNYQDEKSGITGLMIFVSDGCGSMVDHICNLPGADVTLEDHFGRSAGLMAIAVGRSDIGKRIDERITQDILSFDPNFFNRAAALAGKDKATNIVRLFANPKGESDPSP